MRWLGRAVLAGVEQGSLGECCRCSTRCCTPCSTCLRAQQAQAQPGSCVRGLLLPCTFLRCVPLRYAPQLPIELTTQNKEPHMVTHKHAQRHGHDGCTSRGSSSKRGSSGAAAATRAAASARRCCCARRCCRPASALWRGHIGCNPRAGDRGACRKRGLVPTAAERASCAAGCRRPLLQSSASTGRAARALLRRGGCARRQRRQRGTAPELLDSVSSCQCTAALT